MFILWKPNELGPILLRIETVTGIDEILTCFQIPKT